MKISTVFAVSSVVLSASPGPLFLSLSFMFAGCAAATEQPALKDAEKQTRSRAWLADYAALQRLEELGAAAASDQQPLEAATYYSKAANHARRIPSPTGSWLRVYAAEQFLKAERSNEALQELRKGVHDGFRFHKSLAMSSSFKSLERDAEFQKILHQALLNAQSYADERRRVEDAKLEFSDVSRFWKAYDLAKQARGSSAKAAIFRREYLGPGTPGLIDYHHIKIGSMENLVAAIQRAGSYYDGIREQSLKAQTLEPQIRDGLRKLGELYPEATFPDVTFVIGRMNSGGTAGPAGMLIGLDIWSWTDGVPLDNISGGMQTLLKSSSLEKLPWVVVHEHVHALQVFARNETLLDAALVEGSADFIAGLALPSSQKPHYYRWGLEHEAQVWTEFQKDMSSSNTSRWIANQNASSEEWAADLGYFIGARICEAYYKQAKDKRQAIKDLLFVESSEAILRKSGYGQ